MKTLLIILMTGGLLVAILFVVLANRSQSGRAPGLVNGKLAPCPNTPNCLCSDHPQDTQHMTAPLSLINGSKLQSWAALKQAVEKTGGSIKIETDHYLAATFTSKLFGFVDDFEARFDTDQQQIQLRAASRVGRSDWGANLKRIENIRKLYQ